MDDLTGTFRQFRECARLVWNAFLRPYPDGEHDFIPVEDALFNAMMASELQKFEHDGDIGGRHFAPGVIIVPSIGAGALVATDDEDCVRWSAVTIDPTVKLCYAGLFDFDTLSGSYREFKYVETVVVSAEESALIAGQRVLVEADTARVYDGSASS